MRKLRDETLQLLKDSQAVSKGYEENAATMNEAIDLAEDGVQRAKDNFKP